MEALAAAVQNVWLVSSLVDVAPFADFFTNFLSRSFNHPSVSIRESAATLSISILKQISVSPLKIASFLGVILAKSSAFESLESLLSGPSEFAVSNAIEFERILSCECPSGALLSIEPGSLARVDVLVLNLLVQHSRYAFFLTHMFTVDDSIY